MKKIKLGDTEITIISLKDETPEYIGYSDIISIVNEVGSFCFRTTDFERYSSSINLITAKEFIRLKKYKAKEE